MKKFKGITSIFMVACMLVSLVAFDPTYAVAETSSVAPATPAEKIDAAIWDTTPDEQGRYLVYISRNAVSDDEIEAEFNKRNEFTLAEYTDETLYRRTVGPSVAVKAGYKYGLFESLSMELGRELYDDNISPFKYELIENYNNFMLNKREVISDLYSSDNEDFISKYNIDDESILYEGIYTGSIVAYLEQNQIEAVSQDDTVVLIGDWTNRELVEETNNVHTQIKTDASSGTKSPQYNYKGSNIKIGIVEPYTNFGTPAGFYTDSPQLQPLIGNTLFYVDSYGNIAVSPSNSLHATGVTSIICGKSSEYNNVAHEGVVPLATVYQTSVNSEDDLCSRVQTLIDRYNVSVINCSFGGIVVYSDDNTIATTWGYDTVDMELDNIIRSTGVTIVASAGNYDNQYNPNRYITWPGLGYNMITVGALSTKQDNGELIDTDTFLMSTSSAHTEYTYLTNKPDIVAPGENIAVVYSGVQALSGTSFAAPFVTGVVAQVYEANETLMDSSTRTKAVVLAGADHDIINTSTDGVAYTGSTLIREKSGVGMLNAVNTVNIARNGTYGGTTLYLNDTTLNGDRSVTSVNLTAGQKVRFVLTYNKSETGLISSSGYKNDCGLVISKGSTRYTSNFVYSNVEVVEFTVPSTGTYNIYAYVTKYTRTPNVSTPWSIQVAWRVK